MRHPKEGAPVVASSTCTVPLINAGDGGHNHPTQTLTDLLTIQREKGTLKNLTVGFCGDLKFGRTVHSLLKAMSRYEGTKFVFISPDELKLPEYLKEDILDPMGIEYKEVRSMEEVMPELDILYMTRVQQERFFNEQDYIRLRDTYILDEEKLQAAKKDMIIMHPLPRVINEEDYVRMKDFYILDNKKMELAKDDMYILHPLPRVNEIATEVDNDPRAAYFRQAHNGRFIRMALILSLLGLQNEVERL